MKTTEKRYYHRKRHKPGTSPGTLSLTGGDDAPPVISMMGYGPESFIETRLQSADDIPAYMGTYPVLWINVDGLGSVDVIKRIGDIFALHALALEDTINTHQRPKTEDYADNIYTVCRMLVDDGAEIDLEQVSIFLGKGFVISFQEKQGDCWNPVRDRIRKSAANSKFRSGGADYLCYALIDAVIDGFFPLLESFGDKLDVLEEEVFINPGKHVIHEIQKAKKTLYTLRHAIWPLRESIMHISNHETLVMPGTKIYLRDCYDHVIQIMDILENYRDRVSSLMDIYLSTISQRMNQVMRVLTVISTIFMPLTFIVGIYGMNFDRHVSRWSMPELGWAYGYPIVMAIMILIAMAMVLFFWRVGWFGVEDAKTEKTTDNNKDKSKNL